MQRIITTLSFFILSLTLCGQIAFREALDITVASNNNLIPDALTGGFNNAQFGEIDLNLDGVKDLVVYDRFQGQVRPYINAGIQDSVNYTYAPEYAKAFPELNQFLMTRDFNNDGKMDLVVGGSNLVLYLNISSTQNGLAFQFDRVLRSKYSGSNSSPLAINPTSLNIPGIYDIDNDNDMDLFIQQNSKAVDYHRNLSVDLTGDFVPEYERRSTCWGQFFVSFNASGSATDSVYLDSCYRGITGSGELSDSKFQNSQLEKNKGLKHGVGLTITPFDYDGNGSTDLLIADDSSPQIKLVLNADSGSAPFTDSRIFKVVENFPTNDTAVSLLFSASFLIDVNNDGKKDLLVASNLQNVPALPPYSTDDIWYYENVATNTDFEFKLRSKQFLRDETIDFGVQSKPAFFDYNKDGLMDILVSSAYLSKTKEFTFEPQFALLENVSSGNEIKFNLVTTNYLDLSSFDFGFEDTLFASVAPTFGDLDGDGDQDLLVTQKNGDLFLFEDTSSTGTVAAFKFHPEPYQGIGEFFFRPISSELYDVDRDGLLDLISTKGNQVYFYKNIGTSNNAIFQIKLDSIIWLNGDTIRYHFSDVINFSSFNIGDTLAVVNAIFADNNPNVPLVIARIDTVNLYFDCVNLIPGGVGSSKWDEVNTPAYLKRFNNSWNLTPPFTNLEGENLFLFDYEGENNLFIGHSRGDNYIIRDFMDSLQSINSASTYLLEQNFMTNFGQGTFADGTDLNGDGLTDLVLGLSTGGLKILYGEKSVGLPEFLSSGNSKEKKLFRLYPNPASSSSTIELSSANINASVQVRDISGQLIFEDNFSSPSYQFSTEGLAGGVYLISIRNGSDFDMKKLIVQP